MSCSKMRELLSGTSGTFVVEALNGNGVEEAVWRALDESGKWHKRECKITAPLVVWTAVMMSVFRSVSIVDVFGHVLEACRGTKGIPLRGFVTDEAIYHARNRLGYKPLELLAKHLAKKTSDWSFFGLPAYALDGVTLDVSDTVENVIGFGRQVGKRGPAAFPQMKGVALLDIGTRQYVDAVWGSWNMSEFVGAEMLLEHLKPGAVLFLDRRYTKVDLWFEIMSRSVHFVHRLSASYIPKDLKKQGDGDYLFDVGRWAPVEWKPQQPGQKRHWQKRQWESRTLRLLEYQVDGGEKVRLITDLLDPVKYPARAIALGYHLRWDIEISLDEVKTHLSTVTHGTQHTTFRSKSPRGVIQEAWGLLVAYNLIRGLMVDAGREHNVPHLDISFVGTVDVIRMAFPRIQSCMPRLIPLLRRTMLRDIADHLNPRPRRKRWSPRVVKQKVGTFPLKRGHRSVPRDYEAELRLVASA
jgi:hypothetical protein